MPSDHNFPKGVDVATVRHIHLDDHGNRLEVGCEMAVGRGPGFRLLYRNEDGSTGHPMDVCCSPDQIRAVAAALMLLADEQEVSDGE